MKTVVLLILAVLLSLGSLAQEKMIYKRFCNVGYEMTLNDRRYIALKPEAKKFYRSLTGTWQAEEDEKLQIRIRFIEKNNEGFYYVDKCFSEQIQHPDFDSDFDMMIGGTGYDNIDHLDFIYFRLSPTEFKKGFQSQVSVSGYLAVTDENTLRMHILGVKHPRAEGESIMIRPDYRIETAPADVLKRVPEVLKRSIITFKRQ